jgi:hypothetical protein
MCAARNCSRASNEEGLEGTSTPAITSALSFCALDLPTSLAGTGCSVVHTTSTSRWTGRQWAVAPSPSTYPAQQDAISGPGRAIGFPLQQRNFHAWTVSLVET